ncbi:MAG: hypothetical protein R2865_05895 [Deinococcales bacterium]
MSAPAMNLRQAMKNLDPKESLSLKELKIFYVPREDSPLKRLILDLEEADEQKFLFTGHRGTGKSSELAKLEAELLPENTYQVIRFSVRDFLDIYDLDYKDVILALFFATVRFAEGQKLKLSRAVEAIVKDLLNFGQEIERTDEREYGGGVEAEGGTEGFLAQFLKLGLRFKAEASTRTSIRTTVSHRLRDLLTGLETLSKDIERLTGRKLLYIVEDLDKTDLHVAETLFFKHAQSLTEPRSLSSTPFPLPSFIQTTIESNTDQQFSPTPNFYQL